MGILSSTRSAMKKIIESSYSVGQFYGEMKKVKNGTRQKLISQVVLTDKQKKEIDDLFQNNYGKKVKMIGIDYISLLQENLILNIFQNTFFQVDLNLK